MTGLRKRLGVLVLSLVLLANLISGCSVSLKDNDEDTIKTIRIGVSVYDQYDTFIAGLMEYFTVYAKAKEEQAGVLITVEVVNASGSQIEQNNQVEDFINNGYDVVCVNLVDRTDPSMIIDKAKNADIPVIFFNRELVAEDLERWNKLYYVGAVALESGIMEGELVRNAFRETENADKNSDGIMQYVMLEGEAGHQDAIVRTEYSVNTVVEAGIEVEKLSYAIANWNRAQAQTKMTQWLDHFGNIIEVVFANNDDMALGAVDALLSMEIPQEEWPLIVGIDGTDVGLEAVRKGYIYGTVYNDKEGQARGMVELAYALSTGNELPEDIVLDDGRYIRLPHTKVTRNNVNNFLKKKG